MEDCQAGQLVVSVESDLAMIASEAFYNSADPFIESIAEARKDGLHQTMEDLQATSNELLGRAKQAKLGLENALSESVVSIRGEQGESGKVIASVRIDELSDSLKARLPLLATFEDGDFADNLKAAAVDIINFANEESCLAVSETPVQLV